jgi:hypothetical protein
MREQDRENVVEPEAGVIGGDDEVPRQPAPPLDPYTPEPAARPGERRAWRVMRLAWLPVLIGLAVVLFAFLR